MMKIPMIARMVLALLATFMLNACDPDEQPAAPPPDAPSSDVHALLPLSFYHIQDSDGGKGAEGVDVILIFEPNGIADLYTARDQEAIAYKGSYTIKDGTIALKFNDADMKFDVSFSIDTSQATVTMPFKAFSTTSGTSTWRRERRPLEHNCQVIFTAATLAENLPTDKAIERVVKYGQAIIAGNTLQKQTFAKVSAGPQLTEVRPLANGVELQYDKGPVISVTFFTWSLGSGKPLTMSPLASDPRVHLNPERPNNGTADPVEKTALLFAPFDSDRSTIIWYDYDFLNRRVPVPARDPIQTGWGKYDETDQMASLLEDNGYRVQILRDDDATLVNLIEALIPGKDGRAVSPGFISLSTHGSSDGSLKTGNLLGDSTNWEDAYEDEIEHLKASGYSDLLSYGGGNQFAPATIRVSVTARSLRARTPYYSIAVTPKFWEWVRTTRHANFSRSLVFVGACLTDKTKHLREAIKARAYFAFNVSVFSEFSGKVFQYFCKSLARPTHSAEETYYNLIRVINTRQMIYAEDKILDGFVPEVRPQVDSAVYNFNGYAYDGQQVVPYWSEGWLGVVDGDQGGIWWLLFSGRWGQDAQAGAEGMRNCWNKLWKDGKTGGLGDPECHNKAPGRAPTAEEVACASYLLTGLPVIGDGSRLIPRWTLNDGE